MAINSALPNSDRAWLLRRQMDRRLVESFSYLADQCSKVVPLFDKDVVRIIEENLAKLPGSLYAIHSQLISAMRSGDASLAGDILQSIPTVRPRDGERTRVLPWSRGSFSDFELTAISDTLSCDYDSTYSKRFDASTPSAHDTLEMASIVEDVLAKLNYHDPETAGEILALVSDIVIIQSQHINAGTCFKAYGLLYLNVMRPGQQWTTYLENIVHEAAHHLLFAFWTVDRIIQSDGNRLYRSPLRTEPRPMSGIYHAMFVLARTIRVLRLFKAIPTFADAISQMSTGYNQAKNPASLEDKFFDTVDTIRKNAHLTDFGTELLEGSIALVG